MSKNRQFGFVAIEDGTLFAKIEDELVWEGPANVESAGDLGSWMDGQSQSIDWYYSSSIDFPHDSGAPRINFRVAIAAGRGHEAFDPINFGETPGGDESDE